MLDTKSKKIGVLLLFGVYFTLVYVLMSKFDITCVFLELFGIPCPGCGMTRAFLSLLKLDIYNAFRYNPVIFFMPYVFAYIFCDLRHKIHKYLLITVAVVALVNWIYNLIIIF